MAKKKTAAKKSSTPKPRAPKSKSAKSKIKPAKGALAADLKANLEKAVKTDRKAVEESISQVKELVRYLGQNWKKVVPSIAALGASAYFMKKRNPKKTK